MNGHNLLEFLNGLSNDELDLEVRICDNKNEESNIPRADLAMVYEICITDNDTESVILIES